MHVSDLRVGSYCKRALSRHNPDAALRHHGGCIGLGCRRNGRNLRNVFHATCWPGVRLLHGSVRVPGYQSELGEAVSFDLRFLQNPFVIPAFSTTIGTVLIKFLSCKKN